MWSGKSLQLQCILLLGMLCLSAISVYVGGYGGLSESGLLCIPLSVSSPFSCSW